MANSYTNQDIEITDGGDLVVSPAGDLKIASIDQTTKQDINIYLFTRYGDMSALPFIGSLLHDFIGEPNTEDNGNLIYSEILRALSANQRFYTNDINVEVIPIDIDTIATYITVLNAAGTNNQTLIYLFNYLSGLSPATQE
jgi:hypothetical protein